MSVRRRKIRARVEARRAFMEGWNRTTRMLEQIRLDIVDQIRARDRATDEGMPECRSV